MAHKNVNAESAPATVVCNSPQGPRSSDSGEPADPYVRWLRDSASPLFHLGGNWWTTYHNALVPACPKPQPINLNVNISQAQEVLRKSGMLFLRYITRTFNHPTDWWYVVCEEYDISSLTHKVRNQIRRGYRKCLVRNIDPAWLAVNGYECYRGAFRRYWNASPVSKQDWEKKQLSAVGGPFEFWGVFVGDALAGYLKCVVADTYVATLVGKFHPDYLQFYPSYALLDTLLKKYAGQERKSVTNGFRSIAHHTNLQEYLGKFGFRKVYCDLKVIYREPVRQALTLLSPFKVIIDHFPDIGFVPEIKTMLTQEVIRRSFQGAQ
jgi:hypothetical protein